ncbi:DUF2786 domain-containing protein [Microbacterium sp. KUDC0406]|uniref:DUF2786 domain-containing protein n=1 Tax=Microbacterium sp. KUDC0406 TaxID=2909588 RepID=UPI001F3D8C1D|nr:DUF2786 domain-containing protein [Microbacterium sp. KUDC0406]UJP09398.1 DUF2786 domain-containing protein [Microbacterium sp. KUDC0406]
MSDTKLDLITKLLAKAESTTPEEAEALTEHAERLMLKYGIEQARIDEKRARLGQTSEEIVQERMLFSGAYVRDIRELGAGVALALGSLHPLYGNGESALYFVGFASDVRQAQILTASLEVQAMVAMRSWWTIERHRYHWGSEADRRRARSGFIRGFGVGAAERIRESRRMLLAEAGTGMDLVLASRKERVDTFVDGMRLRKARTRRGADAGGFTRGHAAGREANTGGTAIEHE